ncbi:type II toxin-antitoxin system RelE/ParE family toxin [Pseudomonas sp. CC120222-01a]|uniref:type II toxin-antitoxin system RelE family toxin n=1 Tax=Pseudomonas sp. CC120222-01a TaxID=1378075 RepID=UPI000D81B53A|nr:type II toxin-antitoxin system mRNA interferase toxin, RelE/StbE family [Pseudomonas sp. CC120222-01a]PVZ35194.1 addiction module RelE/StbE family toxin [Pseudomonas sp. CC120222-01a]
MSSLPKPKAAKSYDLEFDVRARKEFGKLDGSLQLQFARKLKERLAQPRVEKDKLSGMADCYKIKLRSAGYRLVYRVVDHRVVVIVIAVGKRERSAAYDAARSRLI